MISDISSSLKFLCDQHNLVVVYTPSGACVDSLHKEGDSYRVSTVRFMPDDIKKIEIGSEIPSIHLKMHKTTLYF